MCRLESVGGKGPLSHSVPQWGYMGPSINVFPAAVASDNELSCTPPAVIVPGTAALTVNVGAGPGNKTSNQSCSYDAECPPNSNALVEYVSMVDVVVGRRPYVAESHGTLLVTTHGSLEGTRVAVTATLPVRNTGTTGDDGTGASAGGVGTGGGGASWTWSFVPRNGTDILSFPLAGLAPALNADVRIDVAAGGRNVSFLRRLLRAPPRPRPTAKHPPPPSLPSSPSSPLSPSSPSPLAPSAMGPGTVTVVDHATRRLLVDGVGFLGSGWYVA